MRLLDQRNVFYMLPISYVGPTVRAYLLRTLYFITWVMQAWACGEDKTIKFMHPSKS